MFSTKFYFFRFSHRTLKRLGHISGEIGKGAKISIPILSVNENQIPKLKEAGNYMRRLDLLAKDKDLQPIFHPTETVIYEFAIPKRLSYQIVIELKTGQRFFILFTLPEGGKLEEGVVLENYLYMNEKTKETKWLKSGDAPSGDYRVAGFRGSHIKTNEKFDLVYEKQLE